MIYIFKINSAYSVFRYEKGKDLVWHWQSSHFNDTMSLLSIVSQRDKNQNIWGIYCGYDVSFTNEYVFQITLLEIEKRPIFSFFQEHARNACTKTHACKHACGGIKDEDPCLPCLHGCRNPGQDQMKQDADDMCMVCFTEALSAAPAIQVRLAWCCHLVTAGEIIQNFILCIPISENCFEIIFYL